jgi:hypothetical protein
MVNAQSFISTLVLSDEKFVCRGACLLQGLFLGGTTTGSILDLYEEGK